ncbi:hypothetical protein R5O87_10080 [Arthrobacter globiformis]|uniref:hypothetical protein n=1 Tax=Arthrobacter globiformis TaxID=1665 RepID=UPI00397C5F1F
MIRTTRLRGALLPGIAAAMLAFTVAAGAAGTAQAACLPEQQCTESPVPVAPPSSGSPAPTTAAPVPAPAPAPAQPPARKAPAPAPAPAPVRPVAPAAPRVAPVPSVPAPAMTPLAPQPADAGAAVVVATLAAVPVTTASATPAPSSSAPSAESSWTKPIATPVQASQAAAVVVADKSSGIGIFGLFAVMGGVLLVGLGGLAFALWSRNRPGHW